MNGVFTRTSCQLRIELRQLPYSCLKALKIGQHKGEIYQRAGIPEIGFKFSAVIQLRVWNHERLWLGHTLHVWVLHRDPACIRIGLEPARCDPQQLLQIWKVDLHHTTARCLLNYLDPVVAHTV